MSDETPDIQIIITGASEKSGAPVSFGGIMTNFFLDELRNIYGDGRVIYDPQFVGECDCGISQRF